MKRILIFSLAYYPHVGGAEVAIKEISDRISDAEFHMVTMNFGDSPSEEKMGNVFIHRVGKHAPYLSKILFIPRAAHLARRLHRKEPFDLLWAMMSYMLFPIVLARLSVPYVLTLQEGDPFEQVFGRMRIAVFRPLLRKGFAHASAVTAISTFLARWAKRAGFPGTPEIIPNGVDIPRFTKGYSEQEKSVAKERLGKKAGDVFLVTTSRLVPKNAVDDVIRALPLLPGNVHFLVYGIGESEALLRRLASGLGVENRVRFMGQLDHADMPLALAACDIFIRPSRSEGMGNSFIEAMAAGLPVIATQEGGISDFLFDEHRDPDKDPTGWAVDKGAPQQIAKAVETILEDPQKVERVRGNALSLVTRNYSWETIAKSMSSVFDRVAGNR